jgi:hypothetical protein
MINPGALAKKTRQDFAQFSGKRLVGDVGQFPNVYDFPPFGCTLLRRDAPCQPIRGTLRI